MAESTNRRSSSARSCAAGLRLMCGLALAGACAGVLAQGLSGAPTPPPGPRRVTEVSTVPQEPVIVQGGNWGPGHFGGPAPAASEGVNVYGPNVVLGSGGRPPSDHRPVPTPHDSRGGAVPYQGGGYAGGGKPVPYRGSPPGAAPPGAGAQPPPGSTHRWSSGSGAR
jgi:hypothetical protein